MGNEVYANKREVSCKAADGKSICAFPDVCMTPPENPATPPGVPIPYPNTGMAKDTTKGSRKVKITKKEVMLKNKSYFKKSMGDEAGSAAKKGVITSTNRGKVYFTSWSMDVKIEGASVVRMADLTTHNHMSVPGNTPPWPYVDGVDVDVPKPDAEEEEKTGDLEVKVVDPCNNNPVDKADVEARFEKQTSDGSGLANFSGMKEGGAAITVYKHFADADYSTFWVQYPRVLRSHTAESYAYDSAEIVGGSKEKVTVELVVWRVLDHVVLHRKHIDPFGSDKYGHWWTVDGANSYGWWPKYPMNHPAHRRSQPPTPPTPPPPGSGRLARAGHAVAQALYKAELALYNVNESSLFRTFRGVEGELNGQTGFNGTPTQDPHAIAGDQGDEQYSPVFNDCTTDAQVSSCISSFATSYSGGWSWRFEFGNHCHTFQIGIMSHCGFDKVKVLK